MSIGLRWDVTEGDQYSISQATQGYLRQLREPLLIRGYFSAKTHPLLAPLVPQIKDLLKEYELAGGASVRLELIDPADEPELEDEANTKYGIQPVPFQVSDRYQASLVNSYFDILIQYGDEYEVLGFRELIEIKARGEDDLDVQLRNPEYDVTRSLKKVLFGFQGGDSVFDNMSDPVRFVGYVSSDERLPQSLIELRQSFTDVLTDMAEEAGTKFSWDIVDPEADGGAVADQIAADYGFRPMAASLFDANTFYFYLTLTDDETVVQIPIPTALDEDGIRRGIDEGLKRFATGLLKSIALSTPAPPMPQQFPGQPPPPPGNQFNDLRDFLTSDFDVESPSLDEAVPGAADILLVVDPSGLDNRSLFGIDQFLMRGGTVVIAASAFQTTLTPQALTAVPSDTGLEEWLAHHGVAIDSSMVLDPQNAAFPLPVTRQVGGFSFQDYQMTDYPFFVEARGDGLNQDNAITSGLPQLTMTWASPIDVDPDKSGDRVVTELVRSSSNAWRTTSPDVMPRLTEGGFAGYEPEGEVGSQLLGVLVEGRFESYFEESPLLEVPADEPNDEPDAAGDDAESEEDTDDVGTVTTVIERSPESARLIVLGSSGFLSDQTIRMIGMADGTIYTNSIQLMANVVDWALEDESLLSIRSRGHFNRTLPPMAAQTQRVWEYANYALALIGVLIVFGVNRARRGARRTKYSAWLGEAS